MSGPAHGCAADRARSRPGCAVADDEDPVGIRGRLSVVGDQDHGLAALRRTSARARRGSPCRSRSRGCRSARRPAGAPADGRGRGRARPAVARRRTAVGPVLLAAGRSTSRQHVADARGARRRGGITPAIVNGRATFSSHVEQRDQVEELEDEAGLLAAQPGGLASASRLITSPSRTTSPEVGWSSPPRRWSSVLLPEPDGPMRATNSPGRPSARRLEGRRRRGCPAGNAWSGRAPRGSPYWNTGGRRGASQPRDRLFD